MCQRGRINGIGVGTGDPQDMTIRAARLIRESDVLICPRKDLGRCRAYQIVRQAVPEVEHIPTLGFEFEMTRDEAMTTLNHQKAYAAAKELVSQGKTVSFLTIGDPALYSTFGYVATLARRDGIEVRCVSGVSSLVACANSLSIPLCQGSEQLHVVGRVEDVGEALDLPGTKVIMKCGKRLPLVKELLGKREGVEVFAVASCGTPEERCYRSLDELPDDESYLLTIVVKQR